jgi:hypothetical protein
MTKFTSLLSISAPLGFCLALAAPAQAQEIILYRFPGVFDNGSIGTAGVATSFHCTNFSGVTETIRIVVRNSLSNLVANTAFAIPHLSTVTASTHATFLYATNVNLGTGLVAQGTAAIAATSINIICTAMIVDAASASPVGIALRGVRFNPAPGSQE